MRFWVFQVREKNSSLDTLIPLGNTLPDFVEFSAHCAKHKVALPEGFSKTYYRPFMVTLGRMKSTDTIYCCCNCEGRVMCFQGFLCG